MVQYVLRVYVCIVRIMTLVYSQAVLIDSTVNIINDIDTVSHCRRDSTRRDSRSPLDTYVPYTEYHVGTKVGTSNRILPGLGPH